MIISFRQGFNLNLSPGLIGKMLRNVACSRFTLRYYSDSSMVLSLWMHESSHFASYQHIRSPISDTRSSYYLLWATTSTLLSPQLCNRRVKEEQPNCRKQTLYSRSTTHRKVLNAIIDSIGWSSRWCMDANRGPITAHKSAVIRPHLADVRTYPGVISDTGIISANCRAAPRHALLCTS